MKKILLIAVMAIACAAFVNAQPRAIGGRLGEFNGVSYQHSLGESNMLEVEAGFNLGNYWGNRMVGWEKGQQWNLYGHNIQAAVTYDWIDPFGATFPAMQKGEWHWYLGVGAAGGFGWHGYSYVKGFGTVDGDVNFGFAAAAGRVGVEYDFWFPLQLSLDFRPTLGAGLAETRDINGKKGVDTGLYYDLFGICLGVRYKF